MIERVKQFIISNNLVPSGKNIVVSAAVSGGIDSCVLLDILYNLKEEIGFNLEIIHFNHNVRGKASLEDERFVENLSKKYKLKIQISGLREAPQKLTETYLRDERLKFFNKVLSKNMNNLVATGHNCNDNVETFLMRMAKGSRLMGLTAIHPKRGRFIRPLLREWRMDIETYASENNINYKSDLTNFDNSILRNKIRHQIIPYLKTEFNNKIDQNINKIILNLSLHYQVYEEQLKLAITNCTKKTNKRIFLYRKQYRQLNTAIKRGLIEYCISNVYPLNYNISDRNFLIWDEFITRAKTGKKISFLEDGKGLAERNYIIFGELPKEKEEVYVLKPGFSLLLDNRNEITLNKIEKEDVKFSSNKNIEFIDGEKSGSSLMVRYWQKGDKFTPLGMFHNRKLSDFFTDLKLNTRLKKEIPIVCTTNQIIWIAGYRIDEQFKVTKSSKIIYKLELKKNKFI